MTRKMTAAVLYGARDVRFEEVDIPTPGPGGVLVKIEAASVDSTDRKVFLRGAHPMIRIPGLFGHEWAGTVAESDRWEQGARVVGANSAPCGGCRMCRRDRQSMCERIEYLNGAFAPYIKVPERIAACNLYRVPDETPLEEAALSEPLACVLHAVRRIPVRDEDTVAILGCGPMGLMFVSALKRRYGRRIRLLALDHHEERLALAREFGADGTSATGPVDIAIEAVGTVSAHREGLGLLGRGGTLVSFGGVAPGAELGVDIGRMHYEEQQILPIYHHTPRDFREAVEAIVAREIPVGRLITGRMSLGELPMALEQVGNRTGLRTIIVIK
jgi:L-iditol 2-dehydrogenase